MTAEDGPSHVRKPTVGGRTRAQVFGEVRRGGVAVLEPLRERLEAGPLQLGRDLAAELTRGLRLVVAHLPEQFAGVARPERQVAAEHLVEHHAQAVDVGAAVDPVRRARDLLGRHVRRGTGDDAEFGAARPRLVEAEPEVDEDGAAIRREDDVRRLDVAVDDEPGVGVGQGVGHGGRDPGRLRPGRAVVLQPSAEVGAFEEIRDDVNLPPVQADVVDRHDAGVAQLREPAGLLEESLRLGLRHLGAAAEDLDGHGPVELRVVAEVNRAEAAGSQGVPHLVAAEGGGRGRGVPLRRRLGRRTRREVRGLIRRAPRLPGCRRPGLEARNPTARRHRPRARLGEGLPVGCNAVSSSRLRAGHCADRANGRRSACEADVAVGNPASTGSADPESPTTIS